MNIVTKNSVMQMMTYFAAAELVLEAVLEYVKVILQIKENLCKVRMWMKKEG